MTKIKKIRRYRQKAEQNILVANSLANNPSTFFLANKFVVKSIAALKKISAESRSDDDHRMLSAKFQSVAENNMISDKLTDKIEAIRLLKKSLKMLGRITKPNDSDRDRSVYLKRFIGTYESAVHDEIYKRSVPAKRFT